MEVTIAINDPNGYPSYDGPKNEPVWSVFTYQYDLTAAEMIEIYGEDEVAEEYEHGEDGLYHFDEPVVNVLKPDLTYAEAEEFAATVDGPTFG